MKIFGFNAMYPALVLAMIVWGVAWPSAKHLSGYSTPIHIASIRFIFTAVGIFILFKFMKVNFTIKKEGWPWLIVGSLLMACYSYLFFTGIKYGMPGAGGILVTTMTPIISYFIALLIQKRTPNKSETVALTLGLIASVFLLHLWQNADAIFQSGNLFFIASCFLWAFLSRITANSAQYGSPLAFTWWMYLACVFLLFFLSPFSMTIDLLKKGDTLFWMNMFFNGVVNTGIATTIFFFVTSKLGAEKTSMFIYIVPFAAAISSAIFYKENLPWYSVIGGILGITSVVIINWRKWLGLIQKIDDKP
jgi:drug/metabolite transporter (DMT)-like permease